MSVGPHTGAGSALPGEPAGAAPPVGAPAASARCGACGPENLASKRFCGDCGAALAVLAAAAPTTIAGGRFELLRLLGEGGKKRVHLARDTHLEREVALSLIKAEGLDGPGRTRVLREAQAMGRLGANPNIVAVFDLGEEGGQPYLVSELMAGGDLEALLDQSPKRQLPITQVLELATGITRGLAFAHAKVLVNDGLLAIVPALGEERNRLAIRDGEEHVIRPARNVNALAFVHVDEVFLACRLVFLHLHARAVHQQDVFVKLRVTMVAADFAGLDELVRPFENGRIGNKRENRTAAVADRVQIATRLEGFHSHKSVSVRLGAEVVASKARFGQVTMRSRFQG